MRIGIVTDNYFPSVGGTEVSIRNYSRRLEAMGHQVFIFCPSYGWRDPRRESKHIVRLPAFQRVYKDHPLMTVYPGITKLFASYKLDIIHSHTPISAPYVAKYVAKKLDIPHVHTVHTLVPEQVKRAERGLFRSFILLFLQSCYLHTFRTPDQAVLASEKKRLPLKVKLSWRYMLRLLSVPDMVIFPTDYVKDIFTDRGFSGPHATLPTFTDMFTGRRVQAHKSKDRGDDPVAIISVGRLDAEKRPDMLFHAARKLDERFDWELIYVGDGPMLSKLQKLTDKYHLGDRIHFLGSQRQKVIARYLRDADIFVMTSYRFDTQCLALLEAASAGLPIVYCDDNLTVGVGKDNSLLARPNAKSVADNLNRLIRDPGQRHKMSVSSLEESKRYKATILTKRLLSIYQDASRSYLKSKRSSQAAG